MALTVDKLRAKLESLNTRGGGGNKNLWKAQDNHLIRVLPLAGQEEPYRVAQFHYLNNKPVYCPQTSGDHCDICIAAEKFKAWTDETGAQKPDDVRKQDFEVFKKIQAGTKYYFAIVEREREKLEKGGFGKVTGKLGSPAWLAISESNFKRMIEMVCKPELNEMHQEQVGEAGGAWDIIVNTKLGLDLTVDLKKAENKDNKGNKKSFPITDIENTIRFVPLLKSADEVAKLLESIPKFEDAIGPKTSEEVRKVWEDYLAAGGPVDVVTDGLDKTPSNNAEMPVTGKQSVDDAITKLLG